MKFIFTLLTACFWVLVSVAQVNSNIPPGACAPPNPKKIQSPVPFDGSGTLGQTYTFSKCGLNYVTASNKLGQRFSPPGVQQPAAFPIS